MSEERDDLHALITEAHGLLKDLRAAMKEARTTMQELKDTIATEQAAVLSERADETIGVFFANLKTHIDQIDTGIEERFEQLMAIMLGETKQQVRRHGGSLTEQLEARAAARAIMNDKGF